MYAAILGCGPTGLIAAHACQWNRVNFDIYSQKRKSELFGSQYLHDSIPGVVDYDEGEKVYYFNEGSPEEYRRKTHGKFWDGIIVSEDFETAHTAWNIREAYDRLWRMYSKYVIDYIIPTPGNIALMGDTCAADIVRYDLNLSKYDLVISTVPRTIWKLPDEEFVYSEGWALGDAPERALFVPYDIRDMTIICDGTPNVSYNRLSCVFGYKTVEWPAHIDFEPQDATRFTKPLKYTPAPIDVNPANQWLHVGRYGKWQKGIVVTDAWHDVVNKIGEIRVQR